MWAVAVASYAAYIVSQYIVLFLSRIREYYADQYSSQVTGNANALSSALVAISYGLAKAREPEVVEADSKKKKTPAYNPAGAMTSMGFFNPGGASQFAMTASDSSGNFSPENMRRAMQWDIVNPWAKWFELNSTHPLTAKRIAEIEKSAIPGVQSSAYRTEADVSTNCVSEFLQDVGIALLPYLGAGIGLVMGLQQSRGGFPDVGLYPVIGYTLLFGGIGSLIRTIFSYRSEFKPAQIVALVGETSVSHIRPIPCEITGTIIGRGEPGAFWSSDLVLQDDNGFITLIYRQPLSFLQFLFGCLAAHRFVNQKATVRGWFRRGPGPYFEMKEATFEGGEKITCYYYHFVLGLAAVMSIVGLLIAFLPR